MVGKVLYIKYNEVVDGQLVEKVRYAVDRWQADDKYMGESFITFTIKSPKPIAFSVGDYCEYRGEMYTLNYIPSVSQKANIGGSGEAFVYEQVKMDSPREELDRAIMLDVTPTTGDYVAALGTNYTGSSQFQLYCGETTANGKTLTPVCALAAKIQANLDRAFPDKGWKVLVDTTSTHEEAGQQVLNTHSDEKMLTFDNTTIANALAEVKNTFEIDFAVKGRTIYIGYTFGAITGNEDGNYYYFGYGRGYLSEDNQGKALFELKRTSDSGQKIVTRLRALGSTKNMPYRYYNKRYNLSQSLFPTNLQLPDTFETPEIKAKHNKERKAVYPWIRDVLGDTNDAYIDKNDNCLETVEGLREDCMRWDGSNADLKEIYPSIEEVTYGELRAALCEDQDGNSGISAFPHYGNDERVDEILAIDTDTNVGDGILTESDSTRQTATNSEVRFTSSETPSSLSYKGSAYVSPEREVMRISSQYAGSYIITNSHLWFRASYSLGRHQSENITKSCSVAYQIKVYAKDLSSLKETVICTYVSDYKTITNRDTKEYEIQVTNLPDIGATHQKVEKILLTNPSDIRITFALLVKDIEYSYDQWSVTWNMGLSRYETPDTDTEWTPSLIWDLEGSAATFMKNPFHVYVKDMGFDFVAAFGTSDTPKIAMKSGMCVAREFAIGDNPQKVEYTKNGITYKAWRLTLGKAEDSSLKTYYPSEPSPLAAGDNFVIIGIEMPEVYIQAASMKLLVEATKALADVCDTKHEYESSVDDIYIQRNYDRCEEEGDVTKSVYWKLGAGMKFPFFGIAEENKEIPDMFTMIIDTLTIKEGEGLTPKITIKLSEDFQQSTLQKLTRQVTSITNGSIFKAANISAGGGLNESEVTAIVSEFVKKRFLSKLNPDTAAGIITFLQGIQFANTLLTDIVKSDDWKKIMDDTQLVTGGGMEAYVQYIISQIADKYLRRDIDDEAKGLITFLSGLKSDDLATFLGGIEVAGLAVFKNTLSSETFVSGWSGYGWRLLMKEVMNVIGSTVLKSELEVDELTVRGSLRAFEFIINQLRGENDNFVFAGMQKVQSVDADNKTIYLDTNKGETYCPFTKGDILRCQRFQTGGTIIKQYDILVKEAHVGSLSDGENRIDSIVWEAFSGDINDIAQGDVLCRLDNDRDPERKGIITTTSVGSNSPYIDVIYGLITNPKESLKVRLGKLDGIVNEMLGELSGYGLYSNNAFLTGEFYLSTGEAVSTKIKMLENLFSSSMSKTTYDIKEDDNIVTNCAFIDDMRGWTTVDGDDMDLFFIDDDTPVFMNDDMFSDGHSVASLENVQGKNMLHLLNAGVSQDNALFASRVPEDSEVEEYVRDSEGNIIKNDDGTLKTKTKTIRPTIYISYRYMCKESGSLSIGFNNGRTTQYSSDMGVIVSVDELGTLTENVNANEGVWIERQYKGYYDKLGDFSISTTGEVYIDVLAVTSKPLDDYKNVVSTQLLQQYNVIGFYGKNIDANKQEYTKLYSVLDAEQKKIVNFVGTENLTNGSTVSSLITQSANSIKQTVAETYATKTQVSTIEQTASNISLVVEQTRTSTCDVVYNNNVTIKTDAGGKTMAALSYTITPTFLIANEAQTITSLSVASGSGSGNPRLSISGKSVVVICDQGATLSSPKMLEAVASVTRSERQVDGTTKNVTYKRSMFITVSPAAKGDQGIQGIQGVQGQKGDTGAGEVYTLVDNGSYATLTAADSLTFYLAFVISKTVDGTSSNIDSSWYSNHKVQYKSDSAKISNWTDIALSSNSYAQTILNAIAFDASSYNTTDLFMVRLIETSSGAIMADFTVPLKLSKGAAISITDNRIKIQVLDSDKWAKIDTTANRIEAVVSDLKSKTGIDITNGKIEISSVDSSGKPTGNFIVNTGNFKIKSDGTIECSNGIFSGTVYAAGGEFTGKITATSGKIGVVNISSAGALVTPYWNITADGKLWCSEARIIGEITATSGTFDNCTINETCKAGFMSYTTNKLKGYVINCGLVNYDNLTNAQKENLKLPSVPSGSFLNVRVLSFLQTRVPVTYTLSINDANGVFADNEYFNVYNTTYKSLKIAAGSCYNFLGVNISNRSVWISLDKALPRI